MMNHTCTIGILHDHWLDITNIKERIESEVYGWNSHAKTMNILQSYKPNFKPYKDNYKTSDFLDKRKSGSVTMFLHCPYCGMKINWKAIKQSVTT